MYYSEPVRLQIFFRVSDNGKHKIIRTIWAFEKIHHFFKKDNMVNSYFPWFKFIQIGVNREKKIAFDENREKNGQVENWEKSETLEISEIFFRLIFFRLFDFGPITKIENLENKFWRFRRFRVFDLPLFDLTFSSDRLNFFTLCGFFLFSFLTLFESVTLGY